MEIKVRALKVADVFTVAKIMGKVAKGSRSQIIMLISNKGNTIAPVDLGLTIIQTVCIDAEEDVKAWLSDMAGLKVEEFEDSDPGVLIDIIEQIAAKEDIRAFLARVSGLVNRFMPNDSGKPSMQSSKGMDGMTAISSN